MSDVFEMKTNATADATELVMSGSINERTILEVPSTPGQLIRLNTEGVTRINSLGVSAWIRYMAKLTDLGVPVTIRPLSVALTSQASMISNFLAGATIETFKAPYFCPDCEHSTEQTYTIDAEVAESISCAECKSEMEFDDEMESYLSFRD